MAVRPIVAVVDDDESVRESLPDLLAELGFNVRAFASAEEFLGSGELLQTRCLILDIVMPRMSGPELQRELLTRRHAIPIIFLTAQINESVHTAVMQLGAIACLSKPFSEEELRAALNAALGAP
jgi:FixJ family two-component response regulator